MLCPCPIFRLWAVASSGCSDCFPFDDMMSGRCGAIVFAILHLVLHQACFASLAFTACCCLLPSLVRAFASSSSIRSLDVPFVHDLYPSLRSWGPGQFPSFSIISDGCGGALFARTTSGADHSPGCCIAAHLLLCHRPALCADCTRCRIAFFQAHIVLWLCSRKLLF